MPLEMFLDFILSWVDARLDESISKLRHATSDFFLQHKLLAANKQNGTIFIKTVTHHFELEPDQM